MQEAPKILADALLPKLADELCESSMFAARLTESLAACQVPKMIGEALRPSQATVGMLIGKEVEGVLSNEAKKATTRAVEQAFNEVTAVVADKLFHNSNGNGPTDQELLYGLRDLRYQGCQQTKAAIARIAQDQLNANQYLAILAEDVARPEPRPEPGGQTPASVPVSQPPEAQPPTAES